MKKQNIILTAILVFIVICLLSCGRNLSQTSISQEVKLKSYDSSRFDYYFIEAVKQKLMGNIGEALQRLEQCLKINPESDAAYFQKAQLLVGLGDNAQGKVFAIKAHTLDPDNFWYLMMLAGLYYNDQNIDSAIIFYEKAVVLYPDRDDLLLNLGNLYSESGKYDNADLIFKRFDQKYGLNETSTVASIKNLMLAKRYDEALEKTNLLLNEFPDETLYNGLLAEIYHAKGENDKATNVYKKLLVKNPDEPAVQLSYCDFLLNSKSYKEFFLFLNKPLLNEDLARENKISLMGRLIETPEIVYQYANNIQVALMILEADNINDDLILLLRPELLIKQNKFEDAAQRLEEIISGNPDNYFAWEKLLLVYLEQKNFKKLQEKGRECSTRFNMSFLAKMLYAWGATENRDYDVAVDELRKAAILAGDNKEMIMQVLSLRADVYYRQKRYNEAFDTFDQALKVDNNDLTILNNYAYYLAEQNLRLKEAEIMSERVIKTESDNPTFLDTYGWVLYKRGKLRQAQKVMESIISKEGEHDPVMYEHLGYIFKKRRDCKNAVINWNIALKLDSTKTELREEIKRCLGD